MAWKIERGPIWRPRRYTYWWALSSHGAFEGRAWTLRGAKRALWRGQAEMLVGE